MDAKGAIKRIEEEHPESLIWDVVHEGVVDYE